LRTAELGCFDCAQREKRKEKINHHRKKWFFLSLSPRGAGATHLDAHLLDHNALGGARALQRIRLEVRTCDAEKKKSEKKKAKKKRIFFFFLSVELCDVRARRSLPKCIFLYFLSAQRLMRRVLRSLRAERMPAGLPAPILACLVEVLLRAANVNQRLLHKTSQSFEPMRFLCQHEIAQHDTTTHTAHTTHNQPHNHQPHLVSPTETKLKV
jgi:hypothetical protein